MDNAVFWPLSTAEASAVNEDLRIVNKKYPGWAMQAIGGCAPPGEYTCSVLPSCMVAVQSATMVNAMLVVEYGVRPAFNLNLSSVLFTSAAVGGKPDGGLDPDFRIQLETNGS